MTKVIRFGREWVFYPEDALSEPYRLWPFSVPSGIKTIEIQYSYDKDRENIIDLGLFDSRGAEFLQGRGFRGWSGSAKDRVIVSEKWATPGYLPGPIYPGTWHILLGLYQIKQKCRCQVEVTLSEETTTMCAMMRPRSLFPNLRAGWLKGDLHCHTIHSDAHASVAEVWGFACKKGLDFIAVTDHNTISHFFEIKELNKSGALIIPGVEVTTYHGHANVLGVKNWVEFRCQKDEDMQRVCEKVHAEGGLFSINHPKDGGPKWGFSHHIPADSVEVWQSFWAMNNQQSFNFWNSLLRMGRRVVALGGSDTHPRFSPFGLLEWLGYPTTWIYVSSPSVEGLLNGIRSGRVTLSACAHGPFLELTFFAGEKIVHQGSVSPYCKGTVCVSVRRGSGLELHLFSSFGPIYRQRVESDPWEGHFDVDLSEYGFIGATLEVHFLKEVAALANPIWCEAWLEKKGEERWKGSKY